jgi:hypothetical protein
MFVAALDQESEVEIKMRRSARMTDAQVNAPPERDKSSPSGKEVMAANARQIRSAAASGI